MWRWHRPSMQLHAAHSKSGELRPLTPQEAELLLMQSMEPSDVTAEVSNQSLVFLARAGSDDVLMKLPLLGTEVSIVEGKQPFIVVRPEREDVVWLFHSDGAQAANKLLEEMGASGAVRKDVSLDMEASPCGTGATALIHVASTNFHGSFQFCAVKVFRERGVKDVRSMVLREMAMLSQAQGSPQILRTRGLWSESDSPKLGLLLEYCSGSDVEKMTKKQPFREGPALDVICEVLQGLTHLHGLGIIHRDIKSANILFRSPECGQPVIADFGLACHVSDFKVKLKCCGSPGYTAPEIIRGRGASTKSDIFSTGCTLYFMLCGKLAFSMFHDDEVETLLVCALRENLSFSDPAFAQVSAKCKRFLKQLTKKAAAPRPSAAEALGLQCVLSSDEDSTSTDEDSVGSKLWRAPQVPQLSMAESVASGEERPLDLLQDSTRTWADSDSERSDEPESEPARMPTVHSFGHSCSSMKP